MELQYFISEKEAYRFIKDNDIKDYIMLIERDKNEITQ